MRTAGARCVRVLRGATALGGRLANSYPKLVECNICGWSGRRFENNPWHPHTTCPRCGLMVRHRLVAAALLQSEPAAGCPSLVGKAVLHVAPEAALGSIVRTMASRYITADIGADDVDCKIDLTDMSGVNTGEFDAVIACDVLEHVDDDRRAIREIARVLGSHGVAILTVPQKDDLEHTFEDAAIVDPLDRARAFGQADHLRIYGEDFPQLLESEGFRVTVITEASFPVDFARKHVLFPPIRSAHPLATNYRKVFVARKA